MQIPGDSAVFEVRKFTWKIFRSTRIILLIHALNLLHGEESYLEADTSSAS